MIPASAKYNNKKRGASLIEIVVGAAILIVVFMGLGSVTKYLVQFSYDANIRTRSAFLASEGIEAVKLMRDRGWNSNVVPLALATPYYLEFSQGQWRATSTPIVIDGMFTRTFVLAAVARDAFDDIVPVGTNDPDARKVTVTTVWSMRNIQRQDTLSTYLTNLFKN